MRQTTKLCQVLLFLFSGLAPFFIFRRNFHYNDRSHSSALHSVAGICTCLFCSPYLKSKRNNIIKNYTLFSRNSFATASMSGVKMRSLSQGAATERTSVYTASSGAVLLRGRRSSSAWHAASSSMANTVERNRQNSSNIIRKTFVLESAKREWRQLNSKTIFFDLFQRVRCWRSQVKTRTGTWSSRWILPK